MDGDLFALSLVAAWGNEVCRAEEVKVDARAGSVERIEKIEQALSGSRQIHGWAKLSFVWATGQASRNQG